MVFFLSDMAYLLSAAAAFLAAFLAALGVRRLAVRAGAVDKPDASRKLHDRPVPLWGGAAVFVGLVAGLGLAIAAGWLPGGGEIRLKHLIGFLLAALVLAAGGMLDDKYGLQPSRQVFFPVLAAAIVIVAGVGIRYVTNPLGGLIHLDHIEFTVLWWEGIPYRLTLLADLFSLLWLLGMTYTTKLLDGLDGLVSGLTVIGCLVIAAVSQLREVAQPDTALVALVAAAAFGGFLILNFHPAKLFLGEGGSTLAGFTLGALAIISGGKIATALLILGLPILDAALVIVQRIRRRRSPFSGDRGHLHFRLLEFGWSHRQAVLFYYLTALLFGVSTLVLRGPEKVAVLAFLAVVAVVLAIRSPRRAVRE